MTYVLLVEPNILLARMYTAALMQETREVSAVRDAQSAIHAADSRRPDIVILELQLPGHNGIEFLHEFRSYPEWRGIPAVVHTLLHPSRLQGTLPLLQDQLGVCAVLYKPSTKLTELCRVVHEQVAPAS